VQSAVEARRRSFAVPCLAVFALGAAACSRQNSTGDAAADEDSSAAAVDGAGEAGTAFEPATPFAYVAKVKNVLVGLQATDDEVAQVASDPTQLKTLITAWMQLPQYKQKMKRFFELAFQQTQISTADFADQVYPG